MNKQHLQFLVNTKIVPAIKAAKTPVVVLFSMSGKGFTICSDEMFALSPAEKEIIIHEAATELRAALFDLPI